MSQPYDHVAASDAAARAAEEDAILSAAQDALGVAKKRIDSLTESSRRLLADHEEMLSLLREASEALEPFVKMDEPGWTHTGADVARAQDVLAKIAKALTS